MIDPEQRQIERQIEQELESRTLGRSRYFAERLPWKDGKERQVDEGERRPGQELLRRCVLPTAEAISRYRESALKRASRKSLALPYLVHIDPEEAAYLTARVALNGAVAGKTVTTVAFEIAAAVQDHLNFEQMAETDPGLYRTLVRQLKKATSGKHRTGVLRNAMRKYNLKRLQWTASERLQLGSKLLDLFIEAVSVVRIVRQAEGRHNTPVYVRLEPAIEEALRKAHEDLSLLCPVHMPMLVEPRDWTSPTEGGYLTSAVRAWMIRVNNRERLEDYARIDMPEVYSAINRIQRTPWRINRAVLRVMEEAWRGGAKLGGLPPDDTPRPPRPAWLTDDMTHESMSPAQIEEFKEWKARAAKVYEENARRAGARIAMAYKLYIANRFKDEGAIYFPHYFDFRGRIYPFAEYLNPQGDDTARGLLEFAEGKPLGEQGAFWLAVHIANLFGVDKVSFADRVEWTRKHSDRLIASALAPFNEEGKFWTTADKPYQALAACFEWAGYQIEGNDYVSHLPITMDGSCSGLQHFSAMLRDPQGGAAVNLTPAEKPADIYTAVAKAAQAIVDRSTDATVLPWQGEAPDGGPRVNRKIAKQPTMTLCYSATSRGRQQQIESALRKLDEEHGRWLGGDTDNYHASVTMAGIIEEAMGEVVVAAKDAMKWLRDVARVCTDAGIPIAWTTPIGFPARQAYTKTTGQRLEVFFGGRRVRVTVVKDGEVLDRREQTAGIAPNFVHSLDSAHLMASVNLGAENGLEDWAVVHDSFGVHACDVDTLHAVLRETFVEQYSGNVLERLRDEIANQLKSVAPELIEELPPVPPMGTLDIEGVREAAYFFA